VERGQPPLGAAGQSREWLDLELPVPAEGRYHVVVYLVKARDYGIVQFHLDGKPLGKPIDCSTPSRCQHRRPSTGDGRFEAGTATLRGEVVGTNPKSDGLRYMWGLDCVVLKRPRTTPAIYSVIYLSGDRRSKSAGPSRPLYGRFSKIGRTPIARSSRTLFTWSESDDAESE